MRLLVLLLSMATACDRDVVTCAEQGPFVFQFDPQQDGQILVDGELLDPLDAEDCELACWRRFEARDLDVGALLRCEAGVPPGLGAGEVLRRPDDATQVELLCDAEVCGEVQRPERVPEDAPETLPSE